MKTKPEGDIKLMDEDAALLEAFRNGDELAFEKLVAKYKSVVFKAIYPLVSDVTRADDIAQEVFLKVYFHADSFKHKSSFYTWLYRITINQCYNALKQKKDKFVSFEDKLNNTEFLKIKDVLASGEETAENKMLREELRKTIKKAINSLPKKYSLVLTLTDINGLSYRESARILDIGVNKLKVWLFRARNKLKEKLAPIYESYINGGDL